MLVPAATTRVRLASVPVLVVALLGPLLPVPLAQAAGADDAQFTDSGRTVACGMVSEGSDRDGVACMVTDAGHLPAPLPPEPSSTDCPSSWLPVVFLSAYGGVPTWGQCRADAVAQADLLTPSPAGSKYRLDDVGCTVLEVGVTCRRADGYGFTISPTELTFQRPRAKSRLSPTGLGRYRLGMTKKQAKRKHLALGDRCGFLPKRQGGDVLFWAGNRLNGVAARPRTQSTQDIGVGSTYDAMRSAYRSGRLVRVTDISGGTMWVFAVRKRGGTLLFGLNSDSWRRPVNTDLVSDLMALRTWSPHDIFGWAGC